jgi:hypothetical protein
MISKFLQNSPLRESYRKKGVISIYVLVLSLLFLTLGLALLSVQLAASYDTFNIEHTAQARLLAQSALEEAIHYSLRLDPNWSGTRSEHTVAVGGKSIGTFDYTVTKCGTIYDITARGFIPNSTAKKKIMHTLTHRLRNPHPYILFSDGFENNNFALWSGTSNDSGTSWDIQTANPAPKVGTRHGRAVRTSSGSSNRIARLLTPTFDLHCYDTVELRFSYRTDNTTPNKTGNRFQVYQNSGRGWVQLFSNSGASSNNAAYVRPATRLSITSLTSTVQFRFEGHMDKRYQAWFLDAVELLTPFAAYDLAVDS